MEELHWLWPTLVLESEIPTSDLQVFNRALLKNASSASFWDITSPEMITLKDSFIQASSSWLHHSGIDHLYETPELSDGWVTVYQPGQFIQPHYHGAMEVVSLYYLTDETDESQRPVTPIPDEKHTMSRKHGHTSFHDPRGAFELRPNPVEEFKPQQGKIITAPGHLLHWSLPTNKLRVVIGTRSILKAK